MRDFLIIFNGKMIKTDSSILRLETSLNTYFGKLALSYGSTLEGRMEAFRFITKHHYKPPLIISDKHELYYILTRSLKEPDCVVIDYCLLKRYKRIDDHKTKLVFSNGFEITLNINYRIIKRQIELIELYKDYQFKRSVYSN